MTNHVYINKKLVYLGDCIIEQRDEPDKFHAKIQTCNDAENPHTYSNDEIIYFGNVRNYITDDKIKNLYTDTNKGVDDFESLTSFVKELNKSIKYKYYIIYSYIHSNIWLTLEQPSCRWDGGIFAIAQVKKQDTEEKTDELFINDFKQMQAWYAGDVYEICIYDELNNFVDNSLGYFYGEEELMQYISKANTYYNITKEELLKAYNNR